MRSCEGHPYPGQYINVDVIKYGDFWAILECSECGHKKEEIHLAFSHNWTLPEPHTLCPQCREGWDIGNCHDTVVWSQHDVYPLDDFVGQSLKQVKAVYSQNSDAVYFMQSDTLIRNDRFIDTSPKYPDPKHDWEEGIMVNERGWMGAEDLSPISSFGAANAYRIHEGDEGFFNKRRFYHADCNVIMLRQTEEKRFFEIFQKAGFQYTRLEAIPNEYCPCSKCAPWFDVTTEIGEFRIGWRKRVINIEWKGLTWGPILKAIKRSAQNLGLSSVLFGKEDVTKGDTYIHAWGWDKATEYLRRIREHVERLGPEAA